jgi:prepilin-type N-terminal cleavage/methylation domain-containing protein
MKNTSNSLTHSESGFTLIELLVTIAILSILSGLSIVSFIVYRENAEYAKGTATMRNARTALSAGQLDLPDDYSLAYTQTDTAGGKLAGQLAEVMPGGNMPNEVRLGVEVSACDQSSGPFDRADYLVVQPCRAKQEIRWQRFCGGTEVLLEHISNASPCA